MTPFGIIFRQSPEDKTTRNFIFKVNLKRTDTVIKQEIVKVVFQE